MATLSKAMLISFLFMALTASFFSNTLALEAVLDINGAPVKPNVPYFIKSATQSTKAITRGKRVLNTLCPQVPLLEMTGNPTAVKFITTTGGDIIALDSDFSIAYEGADVSCQESGIWNVASTPVLPLLDITASGSLLTPESTFQIKKQNNGYKLVHGAELTNIGVYTDALSLVDHLVLSPGEPVDVVFQATI